MASTIVPLTPDEVVSPRRLARARLFTPFVAQIAATDAGAPQTRQKRRIDQETAATAYETGDAHRCVTGRVVTRDF